MKDLCLTHLRALLEKEDFEDDSTLFSISEDTSKSNYTDAYKKAHFLEVENHRLMERIEVLEGKRKGNESEVADE